MTNRKTNPMPEFALKPNESTVRMMVENDRIIRATRDRIAKWRKVEIAEMEALVAKLRKIQLEQKLVLSAILRQSRAFPNRTAKLNISLGRRIEAIRQREFQRLVKKAARDFSMKMLKQGLTVGGQP